MGKEFTSAVVLASVSGIVGIGSIYGTLTVDAAAVEAKVGAVKLAGRKSVLLCAHPDNSGYIYVGLDNTVTAAKFLYVLQGGAGISIDVVPEDNVSIYVIGSAVGQKLGVMEGI